MKIAFTGAGQMGLPMVHRLLGAGRDLVVHARRAEVREECAAAGAPATGDLREAVADADVVLVCLYADAQLREVALGPDGFLAAMKPGAVVASHTTGSPTTVRELAAAGVRVVDAPVSGSAEDIAAGHVTVLLGGADEDVEVVAGVVSAYGDPVLRLGPLGSAQTVKLLNNALFAAQVQLVGEVCRLAEAQGIDPGQAATAIQRSSGSSFAMGLVEATGSIETLVAGAGPYLHKDVTAVREVAAELGLDLGELGHVNEAGPLTFAPREG
jgi:3-hydroxyisobutyrate dehydrogenase-like beta-hydroxyacid dehydrogenase